MLSRLLLVATCGTVIACTDPVAPGPETLPVVRVDTVYVALEVCTRPGQWPAPDPPLPPR